MDGSIAPHHSLCGGGKQRLCAAVLDAHTREQVPHATGIVESNVMVYVTPEVPVSTGERWRGDTSVLLITLKENAYHNIHMRLDNPTMRHMTPWRSKWENHNTVETLYSGLFSVSFIERFHCTATIQWVASFHAQTNYKLQECPQTED